MTRFLLLLIPLLLCGDVQSAEYHTDNFSVTCSDAELAQQIGDAAEHFRKQHAVDWLGAELPKWFAPCPVTVKHGNIGAGGATTFSFDQGHVFGWQMNIQGSPQRLLDSVVPHEVLHTVFASHFRRMVPRWADEGACTYCESESERNRNRLIALEEMRPGEMIPIQSLLTMPEYPKDGRKIALFYSQSALLSEFLIDLKGKPEFVAFLSSYFRQPNWLTAFRKHYGQAPEQAYAAAVQVNRPTPFNYDNYHIDYFSQEGCPPCIQFETEQLPALVKAKIKVVKIDLSKSHNKERGKQDGITGTPAFIIYKNGVKQKVIRRPSTAQELLAACAGDKPAKTVQVAQGVGIGYFGPLPGSNPGNRANPHNDLSAAQTQLINQIVDQRSQMAINSTISSRMSELEKLMDSRLKNAILEIQANLTDEQKALINASDDQKAKIAGFTEQIAVIEAGKAKFIEDHEKALVEEREKREALAKEVEAAKTETKSVKEKLAGLAKEGVSTALESATATAGWSVPLSIAGTLVGWFLSRRKEEKTEPAKA
ncbi:thioredoxin domain-containing protein [Gimesia sp.]|uniref:thioredoxin domain-containing protein n=1 Tax=Gimesia sp. TaxID=2024833 RepID=UPI003A930D85